MCKDKLSQDTMFGLKEGKVIHISEILIKERGLKCNCTCVKCGQPLVARLGEVNEHYFAHHVKCNCKGSIETALHLFAKEVLQRNKKLVLPKLSVKYYIEEDKVHFLSEEQTCYWREVKEHVFAEHRDITFDKVEIEYAIADIVADAALYKANRHLLVEVKVTHEVDVIKLNKIKEINVSTIEVDLSKEFDNYYEFDRETVESAIINNTSMKRWIYNVNYEGFKKKLQEQLEKQLQEQLRKEKEEHEKKMRYFHQKHEEKIDKIKLLLDAEYQNAKKIKWDKEINQNPLWIRECSYIRVTKDSVPIYLNKEIQGEFIFNCDRRIWQTKLFNIFIYNWNKKSQVIDNVSVKYLVDWVKEKSGLPLNNELIYTKDVEQQFPNIHSLSDVIYDFLVNLSEYNFVKPSNKSLRIKGNHYYWWFEKIEDKIRIEINDDAVAI
jgi:hypothetical protein